MIAIPTPNNDADDASRNPLREELRGNSVVTPLGESPRISADDGGR
jgi:hypothetical protein